MSSPEVLHAGLIAARMGGRWRGVLISGPADAGKSDLALRALAHGFRLVADDRVVVWASEGRLFGRAPDALAGLVEIRGLDVLRIEAVPLAEIAVVAEAGIPDRIPEPAFADILGLSIPKVILRLGEPSAPAKLGRALTHFDGRDKRRI